MSDASAKYHPEFKELAEALRPNVCPVAALMVMMIVPNPAGPRKTSPEPSKGYGAES
jgi:hypothetical protein